MVNKKQILCAAIIAVVCILILKRCDKEKINEITKKQLTNSEQEAIVIDPTTGTITTIKEGNKRSSSNLHGRLGVPERIPSTSVESTRGAREIRISLDKNGELKVDARTKGFINEIGFSIGEAESFRLGIDTQFYFYRAWGLLGGVSMPLEKKFNKLSLYVGINYLLPWKYTDNTSVYLGYDSRKNVNFGLRIKL